MENSQQLFPLCAYNKKVYQVCFTPKCKQVCFICDNKCQCQCQTLHQECDKVNWNYITKKLNREIIKHTPEFKSFSDTLDQLYQNTIKDINKAYDDFKAWRDDFGLTQSQSGFLKLIEEGRFTGLTSAKIYEIRKQIRTSSKIIMKSQNQLKEQIDLINTYTQKVIQQLKGLYNESQVIKKQLVEQQQDKNNTNTIKVPQRNQLKLNLAHKVLGLNENGSRFFTMVNEGVIYKQLQTIETKLNQNEESIIENKKITNETINNIKQDIQLSIEKLSSQSVKKIDSLLKMNLIKCKLITSINVLTHFLKTSSSYILFQDPITRLLETLKEESLNQYLNIEEKLTLIIKNYNENNLQSQKFNQQFNMLEEEAQGNREQVDLKMKLGLRNIKTNTISIFFSKKIKTMNLLYKASENNFQVNKFWDKCNGKTNTVTILKTQFSKIIGGYTPLAWNKGIGYQQDPSKQTFLFSITEKYKIPVSNSTYALYHNASYGPTFGNGYDLCIDDKANTAANSYGRIGNAYNKGEYSSNQQGYMKWSGQSRGSSFLIQQWEIYEITFE